MTKSTITRERIQRIIRAIDSEAYDEEEIREWLSSDEIMELSRMALSAMDGEPVAEVYQAPNVGICAALGPSIRMLCPLEPGTKLYRHAQPALVIPDEMTAEQAYEIGYYYGEPVNVFARGANWMRQHIIDSTLAAAPQSPGSEPATVPGKWIPVSERKPDCWCLTCRPVTLNDMRFVVCPDCGNKRCPRANDHRNACTRSNEPGQEGSAYPAAPQEVRGE